jgi:hypothetical protein
MVHISVHKSSGTTTPPDEPMEHFIPDFQAGQTLRAVFRMSK